MGQVANGKPIRRGTRVAFITVHFLPNRVAIGFEVIRDVEPTPEVAFGCE